MKIPYGMSNFADIRRNGFFYVDKTPFLPHLESGEAGYAHLIFLRPRRMGKSLLISMMEHYYDLGWAGAFDELFGGLWASTHATWRWRCGSWPSRGTSGLSWRSSTPAS